MQQVEEITPYGTQGDSRSKSSQVREMFDNIAPAYDLMNRLMTLGIDRKWRDRCIRIVKEAQADTVLDIAAGTGDMTVALARRLPEASVTGVDLSEGMLEKGREKVNALGLTDRVTLQLGDALQLPFDDNTFDAVTIAFGVRNFEDLEAGYAEIFRVLRPGGMVVVLELAQPGRRIWRPFYKFYTRAVIPAVGRMVSKDSRAYRYLPESIAAVPARGDMVDIMKRRGFVSTEWHDLTLGVAIIYTAIKPNN